MKILCHASLSKVFVFFVSAHLLVAGRILAKHVEAVSSNLFR